MTRTCTTSARPRSPCAGAVVARAGVGVDPDGAAHAGPVRGDVPGDAGRAELPRPHPRHRRRAGGRPRRRRENGTATAGVAAATSYLTDTGGDALTTTTVTGTRTATTASVTVRGVALSVIPGWRPTITQSATVPVERITG